MCSGWVVDVKLDTKYECYCRIKKRLCQQGYQHARPIVARVYVHRYAAMYIFSLALDTGFSQ